MSLFSPPTGAPARVTVPKGSHPPKQKEAVDLARILQALQTMDQNAADRMRDLKVFLFVLPFISGVFWGGLYFLVVRIILSD